MRALAPGHCYHCVILSPSHPPPLSSLLPHVLPSFHTVQTKLIPPLLIVRERARPDRRVRDTGRAGVATGGAPGPQTEPGTSLPPAAAWPRLRLGSRRLSAWGAGAAGSRTGRRSPGKSRGAARGCLLDVPLPRPRPSGFASATQALWVTIRQKNEKCSWLGRALRGAGVPSLLCLRPFPAPGFPCEGAPAPCEFPGTADPGVPSFAAWEFSFSNAALILCGVRAARATCRLLCTSNVVSLGSSKFKHCFPGALQNHSAFALLTSETFFFSFLTLDFQTFQKAGIPPPLAPQN